MTILKNPNQNITINDEHLKQTNKLTFWRAFLEVKVVLKLILKVGLIRLGLLLTVYKIFENPRNLL